MERERVIISDLDVRILTYLQEEKNITEILDKFEFGFSQCKRHLDRLNEYLTKRNYGTFRFVKINIDGKKVLELLK